ncbi:iron sulfur cluster assembly protein Isd11 [Schizosaccharomyces octosporus yFS286]|uniref:Iron sulfur cluster assembly protein Isd11 n=1 Tax=Schizosaccharomyces octosporus (strain yFS286) TaxID=483514 RepID=S9PUG9_SCHOY|nr:iron sulfur cluster assembly protein Isd11 [Schizosaccharomyces octosporus yFS286]EPX71123.1 iron sulfur cluster assembly protein Isd11 [Schizosaccharomyces octosporus yFS286]
MASNRQTFIHLYRDLMKTAKLFPYTYREYTLRRTRDKFKGLKNVTDPSQVHEFEQEARHLLGIVQRQTTLNGMYNKRNLVVENSDNAEVNVKKSFENASQL